MRRFLVVWAGQTVSSVGSAMTRFALSLWIFERTGQATGIALVWLASALPTVVITLLGGVLADRYPRKLLMLACDGLAAALSLGLFVLLLLGQLELWHVYVWAALGAPFNALQALTFSAAATTMVDARHYGRVGSLTTAQWYSGNLFGAPLATLVYLPFGLAGVLIVDMLAFLIAVATTALTRIPQPERIAASASESLWRRVLADISFGVRAIWMNPGLRLLLLINILFSFGHDWSYGVNNAMILTRTGGDESALAIWSVAAGVGGLLSSIVMSAWGGTLRRNGVLLGLANVGAGIGKLLVALGQSVAHWVPAQAFTSANFPVRFSAHMRIWRTKTPAGMQGRVFGALTVVSELAGALGMALGAPLADWVLEPAFQSGGALVAPFGWLVGVGPGAGMAFGFVLGSLMMLASGIIVLVIPLVRDGDRRIEPLSAPVVTTAAVTQQQTSA